MVRTKDEGRIRGVQSGFWLFREEVVSVTSERMNPLLGFRFAGMMWRICNKLLQNRIAFHAHFIHSSTAAEWMRGEVTY